MVPAPSVSPALVEHPLPCCCVQLAVISSRPEMCCPRRPVPGAGSWLTRLLLLLLFASQQSVFGFETETWWSLMRENVSSLQQWCFGVSGGGGVKSKASTCGWVALIGESREPRLAFFLPPWWGAKRKLFRWWTGRRKDFIPRGALDGFMAPWV